jgi:hypothetical protein
MPIKDGLADRVCEKLSRPLIEINDAVAASRFAPSALQSLLLRSL